MIKYLEVSNISVSDIEIGSAAIKRPSTLTNGSKQCLLRTHIKVSSICLLFSTTYILMFLIVTTTAKITLKKILLCFGCRRTTADVHRTRNVESDCYECGQQRHQQCFWKNKFTNQYAKRLFWETQFFSMLLSRKKARFKVFFKPINSCINLSSTRNLMV